jgi:acyl carrier protein
VESNEIYARLTDVFQEVFDDPDIIAVPTLTAADVEDWDSLKHIRLLLSVEKAFKVRFTASEVGNLKNVGELASLIQAKV